MNLISLLTWDTAAFLIKLWFYTHWGFLACIKLKEMKKAGHLTRYWKYIGSPLVAFFLVLDFLFNMIWGSIIFRERPKIPPFVQWADRELLFTDRCKRHYRAVQYNLTKAHDAQAMKRYRIALRWKHRLDVVELNHIY